MKNTNSVCPEQSIDLPAHGMEFNRSDLVGRYLSTRRESVFRNRAGALPKRLKSIASDEADALFFLLGQSGFSSGESGEQLHRAGLKAGAARKLNQVKRQFLLKRLENDQIALVPEIVDIYLGARTEGPKKSIHKIELGALDRTPHALQRSDH
jgi:hypothetical protein